MAQTQRKVSRTKVAKSYPGINIKYLSSDMTLGQLDKMGQGNEVEFRIPSSKPKQEISGDLNAEELVEQC